MEVIYYPFFLLLLLLLLLFLFKLRSINSQRPKNPHPKLPPGPRELPIIGSIHHLLGSLPHRSLRDLSKTYGPLMHLKLGEVSTVVASSPEAAKEIMKTHDITFATRPLFPAINILSYGGKSVSFAPYGEYWRQLRKICILELLSPKRVHSFRSIREEEVHNLILSICSLDGSIVNLSEKITSMVNNITIRATIGNKCKDQNTYLSALNESTEAIGGFDLANLYPSLSWLLGMVSGSKLKVERCHRKMDRILKGIIQDRREKKTTSDTKSRRAVDKQQVEEDLLDVLLRLQEDGGLQFNLTTDCIKAIILGMFAAGSETSSTLLLWAVSELMRNPRVMKRVQSEVRESLRGKAKVTEAEIEELNYLQLVIKETLRLHPPAPMLLPRECQETCEVLGYEIPVKARVVVNVWAMGRDPQYWEDADEFKPERFEGNSIDFKGTSFEFLPFGSGRRMCPGMPFGLASVELPLAHLLYYFDWELPNGVQPDSLDMEESFWLTAHRKSDLCLRPIARIPPPPPLV